MAQLLNGERPGSGECENKRVYDVAGRKSLWLERGAVVEKRRGFMGQLCSLSLMGWVGWKEAEQRIGP